jgi:hypothetical protein
MRFNEIIELDDSPVRTAALVAWFQGLFKNEDDVPVLVGGAAVEVYAGGAYTTGDVDLVGHVPPAVARTLTESGFERRGRHWIHQRGQVFVEFPGLSLDPEELASWQELEGQRVRIISVEDLLVDRLGAWEYWRSSVDGANAYLLWQAQKNAIDTERLERRVAQAGWLKAYEALVRFATQWKTALPTTDQVEEWAIEGP